MGKLVYSLQGVLVGNLASYVSYIFIPRATQPRRRRRRCADLHHTFLPPARVYFAVPEHILYQSARVHIRMLQRNVHVLVCVFVSKSRRLHICMYYVCI